MLQLPELKIGVDTKELETVITTLNNVKAAVDNLGKASATINVKVKETKTKIVEVGEAATEASRKLEDAGNAGQAASKGIDATTESSKRAKKALEDVGSGGDNAVEGLSAVERKLQQTALKMQYLRGETITLKDDVVNLGKGFTSGQASQLATQQMLGATADQVKSLAVLFREFNAVTGANKFDDSISGFIKMRKEIDELRNSTALVKEGMGGTREEVKFLAREIEATTQTFQKEGKSVGDLALRINELKQEYKALSSERHEIVTEAKAIEDATKNHAKLLERINNEILKVKRSADALNESMKLSSVNKMHSFENVVKGSSLSPELKAGKIKEFETAINQLSKAEKDAADARARDKTLAKLEAEMQRAQNALAGFNEELRTSNSNRLLAFENGLKKSGLAIDEQTVRLNAYKKVIKDTQVAESERSRKQLADDTAYIQRAVAPQMTDIFVGLATGQSPLTIMLQQGGQLSDQFRMAGVEANKMGEVMRKSLYGIAPLYLEVGRAIAGTVVGAFVDAGKAVLNYTNTLSGLERLQESTLAASITKQGTLLGTLSGVFSNALTVISSTLTAFTATLIGGVVAGVIALGVAFYKTIEEENELVRVTNLTGASLGLTKDTAIGFANSLSAVNGTATDTVKVISEMGKVGGFTRDQIELVRNTAVAMAEATGKSFEDTVKEFDKFSKSPTKTLVEFAEKTGLVRTEVIAMVAELERQGKKSEAASGAMKAYGEASTFAANKIKSEYGALTRLGIDLSNLWSKVWDSILGIGRTEGAADTVKRATSQLAIAVQGSAPAGSDRTKAIDYLKNQLSAANRSMLNQSEAGIEKQRLSEAATAQEEYIKLLKEHKSRIESEDKDSLSRQAYVNKEKKRLDQLRNEGAIITSKEYEGILNATGKAWDKAHTQKKDPVENFFATSLKSLQNESNQATKELDNLTQSQKKFLDITNDPKFYEKGRDADRMRLAQAVEISATEELRARSARALQDSMKELNAVQEKASVSAENYNDSQKAMLRIFDSRGFSEMTDAAKEELVAKFDLVYANEQLALSEKKRQELLKDYLSDLDKAQDFSRNYTKRVKEIDEAYVEGIITFKEYTEQLNALSRTQKGIINANKSVEEHKKLMAGFNAELQALEDQADAYGKATVAKKRYQEETKAKKKYAEDLIGAGDNEQRQQEAVERFQARMKIAALRAENEITEQWTAGIGDAITTAIFEGGAAGGKKLKSFLVAELRKQISLKINVLIQPFVQGFTQALGLTGAGGSQGGSTGNFLTNGISGAIQSGFSNFAHSAFGQEMGLSEVVAGPATAEGALPTALTDAGEAISSAAGMLGNAMLGFSVSNLISNGYGSKTVSAIGGIASAFLGPIAGVVAGLLNRAFGRKLKDTGVQGTFDTKGFEGQSYQFYKGGWFRSDKTTTSELDKKTESDFALQFQGIKQSVSGLVSALGLTAPAVATFTKSIKLSFNGLTDDQIKQKITDTFTEITDDLVKEAFTTKTETNRFVTELQATTVNSGEDQITTYQEVQKAVTDTTYTMREDIPQWVKAILDAKGYTKEALDIITEMPDKILASLGTSSQELANVIVMGLREGDPEGAGQAFADMITFGIENSLQQSFAQQITGIVTTQLVTPIVTALTNGATITQAIAMASIDTMKTQLTGTLSVFKAIFTSPEIKQALADLNALIAGAVSSGMDVGAPVSAPPMTYEEIVGGRKKEPETSTSNTSGTSEADKGKDIASERLQLEKQLLTLQGNTVELRRLELETIDPSNRDLQQRIWLLEDEKVVTDERKGLEQQLLTLQGNTVELRRLELETIDPSNRDLQQRIWLLEDERDAIEKFNNAFEGVAERVMTPQDYSKYQHSGISSDLNKAGFSDITPEFLQSLTKQDLLHIINKTANSEMSIQARTSVILAADALLKLRSAADEVEITRLSNLLKLIDLQISNAVTDTDKAYTVLEKSIEKLRETSEETKKELENTLKTQEEARDKVKDFFEYIKDEVKQLYSEVESTFKNQAKIDRAYITDAVNKAKQSGELPNRQVFEKALTSVKTSFDRTVYKSKYEMDRDRLLLAAELSDLQDVSGEQLTEAEQLVKNTKKQIELIDDQLESYDKQLEAFREQIDIMRGVHVAAIDIGTAIGLLKDAILSESSTRTAVNTSSILGTNGAIFDTKTGTGVTSSGALFNKNDLLAGYTKHLAQGGSTQTVKDLALQSGFSNSQLETILGLSSGTISSLSNTSAPIVATTGASYDASSGYGVTSSGALFTSDALKSSLLDHLSMGGSVEQAFEVAKSSGFSLAQVENILGVAAGSLEAEANARGIQSFDVGTNYVPSDRLAVIHKGEAIVPKAFNPSVFNNQSSKDNDEDMQNLRYEVRAVVSHVSKLSRNIDRLIVPTTSGDALQTKAVA